MDELVLGPIVGGLSHERAFLWGRAAAPSTSESDAPRTLHAWLGEQPDLSDARLVGTSLPLKVETGYAGVAPVTSLQPDTHSYYALTLSSTPPTPTKKEYPSFKSFPTPGERVSFNFAFGSCFRPFTVNGGQIFYDIEKRREPDDLRFILLLGDNIYADTAKNNGIGKIACTLDEYRDVYRYIWSRPPFRALLRNLPAFMTLDDHEVDDDWRWRDRNRQTAYIPWWNRLRRWLAGLPPEERQIPLKRVQEALQAYWEHQGMHAPHFELHPEIDPDGQYGLSREDPGSLAYTFNFGAAAFFVLDTRTMRVRNRWERLMLGEGQWLALRKWFRAVKDRYPVKFLVTSCSVLHPLVLDFPRDRWPGFPDEHKRLLNLIAEEEMEDLYLLTGDLHTGHAVRSEIETQSGITMPLWEFCASPFEQVSNKLANRTYYNLHLGPVKRSQRLFTAEEYNFGVIRVDFDEAGPPRVIFDLYGLNGRLLGRAGEH